MSAVTVPAIPSHTGSTSVEDLIRYAAYRFESSGVEFHPPRMTRLIRRVGVTVARDAIDAYLLRRIDDAQEAEARDKSWGGLERFATSMRGYADPTPEHAHRNLRAAGWYEKRSAR